MIDLEEKARVYLRLKSLDSIEGKRLPALKKFITFISKEDLEKAKKNWPLEFTDRLKIAFDWYHIKILYEDHLKAQKEKLERVQFVYFETRPAGKDTLGVVIEQVEPYADVVRHVGKIQRKPRSYNSTKIKKFCRMFSVGESMVTSSHTHIAGLALPSMLDLANYRLGNIHFTTEVRDGYFYLTAYRGDSMQKRDEKTYEEYVEDRTPFYRKINFYIKEKGLKFQEVIKIKREDIESW